jgi:hypothetical protein
MLVQSLSQSIVRTVASLISQSRKVGVPATRGPELVSTPLGTGWTASVGDGTVVIGTGKVTFVAAANGSNAFLAVTTEDNTTYEVIHTTANRTAGSCSVTVAGATTAHQGVTTSRTTNGTWTEQVTTSGVGSNTLRIQVTAKAAGTSVEMSGLSVKKVLA